MASAKCSLLTREEKKTAVEAGKKSAIKSQMPSESESNKLNYHTLSILIEEFGFGWNSCSLSLHAVAVAFFVSRHNKSHLLAFRLPHLIAAPAHHSN